MTKKAVEKHRSQCRGASFTCLDCMVHFHGTDYRAHTSCISEAQKYQGHLYREKDKKSRGDKRKSIIADDNSQAMVPRRAYVEDAPEGDDSQAIAVIDVPPRAPTPPSAIEPVGELPENVNVFDFLVSEETPNGTKSAVHFLEERRPMEHSHHHAIGDSQYSQYSNGSQFTQNGFSYGYSPVPPSFSRYDSWPNLTDAQHSQAIMPPPPYVTPAPKERRREEKERQTTEKSDKKRKRHQVEELDLSTTKRPSSRDKMMLDAPREASGGRVLHSGLTGGLNKLITNPEFYEDRIEAGPTPILSPIKRTRREDKREDDLKKDRRKSSYMSYSTTTASSKPSSGRHAVDDKHYRSRSPVERKYHDDKHHRRARSADRSSHYRDDRHPKHPSSNSSDDRPHRKHLKAIEYAPERPASVQPNATNQLVNYQSQSQSHSHSGADLFMSFINKGPDSERGCSINKVLKRYHRERDIRGDAAKDKEDKELWKLLRLRKNERGEIVLFI